MIEVIIPSIRRFAAHQLLASLAMGSQVPDLVTIVSNETELPLDLGMKVRIIRFETDYPYGAYDVVLRRNIAIFASEADIIVTQDDDQVAPRGMIEACAEVLSHEPYCWGHHRWFDFRDGFRSLEDIVNLPAEAGAPRENFPNSFHGWESCYAGMSAHYRETLVRLGGFDMLFLGRHGNEDQSLGRRELRMFGKDRAYIWEPPFAWHPHEIIPYDKFPKTNLCDEHQLSSRWINGYEFVVCSRCPYQRPNDVRGFFLDPLVLPYDPTRVELSIIES